MLDEWGTWWDVEQGTNPGFLYQQNALRDALVASLHFDVFHRHAERLVMANIAQTVNVLQAMLLTDDTGLVLTPTYHVFEMNKGHHDATAVPVHVVDRQAPYALDGKQLRPDLGIGQREGRQGAGLGDESRSGRVCGRSTGSAGGNGSGAPRKVADGT